MGLSRDDICCIWYVLPSQFWYIGFLFESYDHVIEFHFWSIFKLLEYAFGPDSKFLLDHKCTYVSYDIILTCWFGTDCNPSAGHPNMQKIMQELSSSNPFSIWWILFDEFYLMNFSTHAMRQTHMSSSNND